MKAKSIFLLFLLLLVASSALHAQYSYNVYLGVFKNERTGQTAKAYSSGYEAVAYLSESVEHFKHAAYDRSHSAARKYKRVVLNEMKHHIDANRNRQAHLYKQMASLEEDIYSPRASYYSKKTIRREEARLYSLRRQHKDISYTLEQQERLYKHLAGTTLNVYSSRNVNENVKLMERFEYITRGALRDKRRGY